MFRNFLVKSSLSFFNFAFNGYNLDRLCFLSTFTLYMVFYTRSHNLNCFGTTSQECLQSFPRKSAVLSIIGTIIHKDYGTKLVWPLNFLSYYFHPGNSASLSGKKFSIIIRYLGKLRFMM